MEMQLEKLKILYLASNSLINNCAINYISCLHFINWLFSIFVDTQDLLPLPLH